MSEEIYLDNHVATKPSNHVIAQMQPFFKRHWKSALAPYLKGKEPFVSINRQTQKIAKFLGAREKDRFVLTSSGAEAIAHVFQSVYIDHIYSSGKNHIVSTSSEEAPILMSIERLEKLEIDRGIKCDPSGRGHWADDGLEGSFIKCKDCPEPVGVTLHVEV